MIAWLRTGLFVVIFYLGSVPIVLATPLSARFGHRMLIANVHLWSRYHRLVARIVLGITSRFEGGVSPEPTFYAAKHHAMFETLELCLMLGNPVFVIKRELGDIPVWGWAIRQYGAIVVDREANAGALRQMMREAKVALDAGRSVIIFPEGTRVAAGEKPPLRSGFAGLYRVLGLGVVPIAINSGDVWPKKGAKRAANAIGAKYGYGDVWPKKGAKRAGVITFRFGARIPPRLPREDIEARVYAAINELD